MSSPVTIATGGYPKNVATPLMIIVPYSSIVTRGFCSFKILFGKLYYEQWLYKISRADIDLNYLIWRISGLYWISAKIGAHLSNCR